MIAFLLAFSLLQETVETDARCMECHKEAAKQWKTSIHARHDTGCISCHKKSIIDPSKMPANPHLKEKPFIAGTLNLSQNLCGQCHELETKAFKDGQHWDEDINPKAKWSAKKRQGCLSCHEPHGTAPADRKAIYEQRCTHCHRENSSQRKIMTSYMASADPLDAELAALKTFLEHPMPGVPYEKAEAARDTAQDLHKSLRLLQHNTKFQELEKKIEPALTPLKAASAQLKDQYDAAAGSRRKYFLVFLGLMLANLFLLRAWCMKKYGGKH